MAKDADELTADELGYRPTDPSEIGLVTSALDAPTMFTDGLWFAYYHLGTVRLNFLETVLEPKNSPSPGIRSRHVVTIALPRVGFDNMLQYLNSKQLEFDKIDQETGAK